MSIQRQFERRLAFKQGRLRRGKRHNPVAVRLVNEVFVVRSPDYHTSDREVTTFERHYLHATKGWKVDRYSRQRRERLISVKEARAFGKPIVGERCRRLPNPKHLKREAA
ncbi:hypothetical protein [Methylocystis hirsuta]|uniref:Uncharacterized protein n=1 Tax=Methylocystis hirsuta TaxID=369798 RepID=A0A3M9XN43_9HYPH|nr:hypothetical protein [Methylocystis hirsuta]RNJ49421.1 hypothetical protein D1O30_07185 [Methylocystis hirsuta]